MANKQHIEWLSEGVEAWNARRRSSSFRPNFRDGDLSSIFLERSLKAINEALAEINHGTGAVKAPKTKIMDLQSVNLRDADLRTAKIEGCNLQEADLTEADVRTLYDSDGAARPTDLSEVAGLTQEQINSMRGDRGVILPEGLEFPPHWPEPDRPPLKTGTSEEEETSSYGTAAFGRGPYGSRPDSGASDGERAYQVNLALEIKQRSASEIRQALIKSYPQASAMAQFAAGRIQSEIASQRMTAIPNEAGALSEYNARLNFLTETLVIIQQLHSALPELQPSRITDEDAKSLRETLVALAQQLHKAVVYLDEQPGTYGNLWKVGVVGLCTELLGLFGIGAALAVPAAVGLVGVSTVRLVIDRKGRGRGGQE